MAELLKVAAPHIHSNASTRKIMLDVVIALLPATVASIVIFGMKALAIEVTCILTAIVCEALFNVITKKEQTISDFSATVTGLLLALNLSTNVELWQCVVGTAFAILVIKNIFGGLGKNFANPAIGGRVMMIIAFSSVAGGAMPKAAEIVTGATPLEVLKTGTTEGLPSLMNMFLGLRGGTIGESCILALLIGFAYLVIRKVIKWYVPATSILTDLVLYLIAGGFNVTYALYEVMAGGIFLGAIFMATDYVTTPITNEGKVLFCVGCAVLTFIIRQFCALPEGVSFAILTMNLLVPFIETITTHKRMGGRN